MASIERIKQHVTVTDEGYLLNIPVDVMFEKCKVSNVKMFVAKEAEDADGDLAVLWDASALQNTGGGNMGTLLMRGANDEVGEVMGAFYWEHAFNKRLAKILTCISGFSDKAAAAVSGSEWGMQDEGRASYDAYDIATEVRAAMAA